MQRAAAACVNLLTNQGIISSEDHDIYFYGCEVLFSAGGTLLVSLALGFLTGYLVEVILFSATFFPIKASCGGYHAESPEKCMLLSLAAVIISISVGSTINSFLLTLILVAISYGFVLRFSPIIHPNHPHSSKRIITLKRRARIVASVFSATILSASAFSFNYASIMVMAFLIASVGMPFSVWCK